MTSRSTGEPTFKEKESALWTARRKAMDSKTVTETCQSCKGCKS